MSDKKALLAIWLLALFVRLGALAWLGDANYVSGMAQGELAYAIATGKGISFHVLPGCGIVYVQNAQNRLIDVQDYLEHYSEWCAAIGLADKPSQEISENPFPTQMPGMGILLAGTYLLFGQYRYIYLQVIILLLDSLGVLMLYWIGKTLFGRSSALLAALFYALYLPGVRISAAGGIRDAWMPFLLTTCLFFYLRGALSTGRRTLWFTLCGLACALGVYLRPDLLLLPVFLAGLLWVTRRFSLLRSVQALLLMTLPVALLLIPWWVRNYSLYERFMLTSPQLGGTMWEAFGEFDQPGQNFWRFGNPFGAVYDDAATHAQYVREGGKGGFFSQEYLTHFDKKVKEAILSRPDWYALLLVRRVVEVPLMGFDWGVDTRFISARPLQILISRGGTVLLFGAALLGLLAARKQGLTLLLLLSTAIYSWAIHLPISINGRYLFPAYAGLILLAAFGSERAWAWLRSRIKVRVLS